MTTGGPETGLVAASTGPRHLPHAPTILHVRALESDGGVIRCSHRGSPRSREGAAWGQERRMKLKKGFRQLVDEAKARIRTLSLEQARARHGRSDVVFVDLRDIRELERE